MTAGVSDVQQTPDREQIRSQLSCVSGPSALAADSNAKETEGASFQDNVKDEPQEQRPNETDERTLLAAKPSDREFKSVYERKLALGSGSYGEVEVAIRKSDGRKVAAPFYRIEQQFAPYVPKDSCSNLDKNVAVKSIKRRKNDITITIAGYPKPLMTEVAMMAKLKQLPTSPYVIEMFEWFDYPDKIEIVMEYPAPCVELKTLISLRSLTEQKSRVVIGEVLDLYSTLTPDVHQMFFTIVHDRRDVTK
ncbi:hypothetical protein E1301_Tti011209 [Triplophysa tibetana]|uniref:non-specific serine/threonine protein kinase n=1 Tax=Triplophysa tibetana TaxID=1572043 RepID=A0A5A9N0L7_9TELE|nr:hypothetical protein E1301_Tti011209 [Triplophysa tibetana]